MTIINEDIQSTLYFARKIEEFVKSPEFRGKMKLSDAFSDEIDSSANSKNEKLKRSTQIKETFSCNMTITFSPYFYTIKGFESLN